MAQCFLTFSVTPRLPRRFSKSLSPSKQYLCKNNWWRFLIIYRKCSSKWLVKINDYKIKIVIFTFWNFPSLNGVISPGWKPLSCALHYSQWHCRTLSWTSNKNILCCLISDFWMIFLSLAYNKYYYSNITLLAIVTVVICMLGVLSAWHYIIKYRLLCASRKNDNNNRKDNNTPYRVKLKKRSNPISCWFLSFRTRRSIIWK